MTRSLFRSILFMILFTWSLLNLGNVLHFFGKVLSLLSPFLMGCAFAFLMNIVLRPLENRWKKLCRKAPGKCMRPVCLTLSAVTVLGALFAIVFMMLPSLRRSISEFSGNIPFYVEKTSKWWYSLVDLAANYNVILPEATIDSDLLIRKLTSFINNRGNGILTVTWGAATSILSGLFDVLLAFVFALYLLAQKETIGSHLKNLLQKILPVQKAERFLTIAKLTNQTFTCFISGQLAEACIIGLLCFIGMLLLKLPHASIISTFVGITALIPVFGAWLGGGIGTLLILLTAPSKAVWFAIFLLILQQLEGNFIYPRVVGKSVGLPGILVLMAVTLGGEAFGIWGMLLGVPVCAVLYSLYERSFL